MREREREAVSLICTVMGSPVSRPRLERQGISVVSDFNEFILRPLSFFWVNAKHRRGGGEWLEMESFEMEQVWQKKGGGQCFCVASCLSLKSAKPCWVPEPRIRAPVIIGWRLLPGRR